MRTCTYTYAHICAGKLKTKFLCPIEETNFLEVQRRKKREKEKKMKGGRRKRGGVKEKCKGTKRETEKTVNVLLMVSVDIQPAPCKKLHVFPFPSM